ncbi:MAG: hypothetical protein HY078_15265 [Elusimicrobia bacterium]|nr:hypothetical protein [Elusimicrobiota bacterium]
MQPISGTKRVMGVALAAAAAGSLVWAREPAAVIGARRIAHEHERST